MTNRKSASVEAECGYCGATGIYRGFAEPEGVGVVCLNCNGTGRTVIRYAPFSGRKTRRDVKTVRRSRGAFIATGVGPTGDPVSYQKFLAGKMPR